MTDKEVMQMALNALETPHPSIRTDFSDAMVYRENVKAAIEALRAALAQPKKEWVGLTDEEANKLWESTDSDWELMKRTEAKLKEKNT
jgi:hypothetical protein